MEKDDVIFETAGELEVDEILEIISVVKGNTSLTKFQLQNIKRLFELFEKKMNTFHKTISSNEISDLSNSYQDLTRKIPYHL